jgi:hypothetical protein
MRRLSKLRCGASKKERGDNDRDGTERFAKILK